VGMGDCYDLPESVRMPGALSLTTCTTKARNKQGTMWNRGAKYEARTNDSIMIGKKVFA
jgi:hypothetical protein